MKRILMAGSAAALLVFTTQAYNNSLGLLGWSDADIRRAVQDVRKQIASQMAWSIRSMPAQGIKMFFDQDLDNWKQQAADKGNNDRAKYQKLVARSTQILPLASSNPESSRISTAC